MIRFLELYKPNDSFDIISKQKNFNHILLKRYLNDISLQLWDIKDGIGINDDIIPASNITNNTVFEQITYKDKSRL